MINEKLQKLVDLGLIDCYTLEDTGSTHELIIDIGTEELVIRATKTSHDGDLALVIK
jgi:hypothetical protein